MCIGALPFEGLDEFAAVVLAVLRMHGTHHHLVRIRLQRTHIRVENLAWVVAELQGVLHDIPFPDVNAGSPRDFVQAFHESAISHRVRRWLGFQQGNTYSREQSQQAHDHHEQRRRMQQQRHDG